MRFTVGSTFTLGIILVSVVSEKLNTRKFPDGFKFGVATSAYQIEGAWNTSGKGENIWDYLTHNNAEYVIDKSTGDIACDSYTHGVEDVKLIKNLGVDFYRFSISWSRILPTGFIHKVNSDGIRYYNEIINELIAQEITPMITLYHWDLPQSLQTAGGWASEALVDYFEDFARVAFENFGDRVKFWITFNEPFSHCREGYGDDLKAPLVNATGIGEYLCTHTILKAHARVYHVYDTDFRPRQKGNISIALDSAWYEEYSQSEEDISAANRIRQFQIGLLGNPIFGTGDYPSIVKERIAYRSKMEGFPESRLPELTSEEVQYIKGTSDYFLFNHYTSRVVRHKPDEDFGFPNLHSDMGVTVFQNKSWPVSTGSSWFSVTPWAFRKLLKWLKDEYNQTIFISENGYSDKGELKDVDRIIYIQLYLSALLDTIYEDKVDVSAYTFWSLLDNFEWLEGYQAKFGMYSVDFNDPNRTRRAKASVEEIRKIVSNRQLPEETYNSIGRISFLAPMWMSIVLSSVIFWVI